MLGGLTIVGLLAIQKHTGYVFLIARNIWDHIDVRIYNQNLLPEKSLDLGSVPLPVVFILQDGKENTPFFMGQGTKMRIFFIHIILHVCRKTIISGDADLILSQIAVADYPIILVIHITLLRRGRHVLVQFIHLTDALDILGYANPKGFHNVIVNIIHVILEGEPALAPHYYPQSNHSPFLES